MKSYRRTLRPQLIPHIPTVAACLAAVAASLLASPLPANPASELLLPAVARGEAAVRALGTHLPQVAAQHGFTQEQLRRLLSEDRALWVDRNGRLVYVCEFPGLEEGGTAHEGGTMVESPLPLDQTFLLQSRPAAPRKIYLDFTGHLTSGTAWNNNFSGGGDFSTPPFDLDGNPASFGTNELDRIQYIWQRVAEDFAAFEVDVTTEDPGVEGLRKSTAADLAHGIRVCIGGSSSDWYGSSAGGVAYIGSFSWNSDTPCYVFTSQLGSGNEKYTAEAISHEVGHTLGLNHDGKTDGTAYYQGHSNWAPIMGVGYYKEVTQWSKGEYPLANNTQDDLAIIGTYVPFRADDHSDWLGGATQLSGLTWESQGVIETNTDFDLFKFITGAGTVSVTVTPAPRSPDLDIQATLYDGTGAVVSISNPTGLGAAFDLTLPAGTYYVEVAGVGTGDPATGYSDYASLGQYTIGGSVVPSGLPPQAVASAGTTSGFAPLVVGFSSAGSADSDGAITGYSWEFGDGTTSSDPNPTHTYLVPGSYTASLVVTDNEGYTAFDSLLIEVANRPPVATAAASPATGYAPLPVVFSSSGSYDSDGTISSTVWNFGDGQTSTEANPSHTYGSPGTYVVVLTITDNLGATATASLNVSAQLDPAKAVFVSSITMSTAAVSGGYVAYAAVRVVDHANRAVPGATVTGAWSGASSGTASGVTDATGLVTLTAPKSKKTGPFTFTMTGISAAGLQYDPARNLVSSATATHGGTSGGGGGGRPRK